MDQQQADLSNWRTPPFNRWAFRNVEAIIPTVSVSKQPSASASFSAAPVTLDDLRLGEVAWQDYLAMTETDALVVLHGDRLVYEYYAPGMGPATRHILMSASKSVVGLVAGILSGAGRLDLEAPISDLVPEIAGTAYRGATTRQLLDMRTGVALSENRMPGTPASLAYRAASGWDPAPAGQDPGDLRSFFATLDVPSEPHGGPFSYVSANTDLLGWVLERASGQDFATLLSQTLWQPMGAEADAGVTIDRKGAPRVTGGICATARDFVRLGHLVAQGGAGIVPEAWIDDMARNGDREAWRKGEFAYFGIPEMSYRSGWYVPAEGTVFAMGIHDQYLFVDRVNRIVLAKLSSGRVPIDPRAVGLVFAAMQAVKGRLLG
jgi:CubicO group peptidase (beta-lactamase class C family)